VGRWVTVSSVTPISLAACNHNTIVVIPENKVVTSTFMLLRQVIGHYFRSLLSWKSHDRVGTLRSGTRRPKDASSKRHVAQGTCCPRNALSKGRIVQGAKHAKLFVQGHIDWGHFIASSFLKLCFLEQPCGFDEDHVVL
jgi:hypothetical protein